MVQTFKSRATRIAAVTAIGLGVLGTTDSALAQNRVIHNSTGNGNAAFSTPANNNNRSISLSTRTQVLNFPQQQQTPPPVMRPRPVQQPRNDFDDRRFGQGGNFDFDNRNQGNFNALRRVGNSTGTQNLNFGRSRINYSDGYQGLHARRVYNSNTGRYNFIDVELGYMPEGWAFADQNSYTYIGGRLVPTGRIDVDAYGNTEILPLDNVGAAINNYTANGSQQGGFDRNAQAEIRGLEGLVTKLVESDVQQKLNSNQSVSLISDQTWGDIKGIAKNSEGILAIGGVIGAFVVGRRWFLKNKEKNRVYDDFLRGRASGPPPASMA
jgi:hypothetical protein